MVFSSDNCRMDGNLKHCYAELPSDDKMSGIKARSACPHGSHLATITSEEEIEFLYKLICKLFIHFVINSYILA